MNKALPLVIVAVIVIAGGYFFLSQKGSVPQNNQTAQAKKSGVDINKLQQQYPSSP